MSFKHKCEGNISLCEFILQNFYTKNAEGLSVMQKVPSKRQSRRLRRPFRPWYRVTVSADSLILYDAVASLSVFIIVFLRLMHYIWDSKNSRFLAKMYSSFRLMLKCTQRHLAVWELCTVGNNCVCPCAMNKMLSPTKIIGKYKTPVHFFNFCHKIHFSRCCYSSSCW